MTAKSNLVSWPLAPRKGFFQDDCTGGRMVPPVFSTNSVKDISATIVGFSVMLLAFLYRPPLMLVLKSPTKIHGSVSLLNALVGVAYILCCTSGLSEVIWYTFTMLTRLPVTVVALIHRILPLTRFVRRSLWSHHSFLTHLWVSKTLFWRRVRQVMPDARHPP